ncbi:protein I'm not dead yet [Cephus cinctus]|uniref:Protein I'm not dead yet n=1 Tax=Cephus cinctus TaxID=211228 RepID=A0AAJ7W098_CEPCN|nr:protein I'm not dead yet [Cephus cinctus]
MTEENDGEINEIVQEEETNISPPLTILERIKIFLRCYWKTIILIVTPIALIPLLVTSNRPESRCAFVIIIMAVYWVTECLPMPITSLIPLILFPVFGIMSTSKTCGCYMNDTIMVFIGGLIMALAIEHCNLHMRIALGVMKYVGCSHSKLLGGLCTVTMFISMWISNTAATAMMVPIVHAILYELEKEGFGDMFIEIPDPENPGKKPEKRPTKITKAYYMSAAYCSSIGGTGTLVGTGTNLTFKGIFESTFPESPGVNFTLWLAASFPQMIINTFLTWLYLQIMYFGMFRPNSNDAKSATIGKEGEMIANQVIEEKYKALGKITFHEASTATLFVVCILLWLFRKPDFVRGWSEVITDTEIKDSLPVLFIAILMFIIPKKPTCIYACNPNPSEGLVKSSEGLVNWKIIQNKMPWGLMFLLGGGFAISQGSNASCLSKRIGDSLEPLKNLPPLLILCIVCISANTMTEFTSNAGVANIILPVVAQMSVAIKIHPMYFMIPVTLSCSYGFRLPVATPPNAIVCAAGNISTKSLILGGCIPVVYTFIVIIVLFLTYGKLIYDLDEFPSWAKSPKGGEGNSMCD